MKEYVKIFENKKKNANLKKNKFINIYIIKKRNVSLPRRKIPRMKKHLHLILSFLLFMSSAAWAGNGKETISQVKEPVVLMTDVDYIITSTIPFTEGGSVDIINTEHAVVIFRDIKPSVVISQHLGGVLIGGQPAKNGVNCQVKMYAQGTIILPYAKDIKPLTVYSEPNFEGEAVDDFGLENSSGFMNTLTDAKLNNRIRSFKLKRGYMVTFALGTGGWGYSRCFIADQEDLEVAVMPDNMDSRISSYRVFQWQNAQKKGLASDTGSGSNGALNSAWCYTWSTGENRLPDTECVPNHIYEDWPSPSACGGVTYSCHMKTNNEPGNSADDHPQDVQTVLNNWQNLMRTGLRLCSETSHDGSWNHLKEFIREVDARGWRCDLLDLHCYWASGSFWSLQNYYNDYGKRPIWISEFVWGASWNNNGIFGEAPDGKNSFSTANQQKNYNGMKPILDYLNSLDCIERYAYWNSEADCSKIYRSGELSILGKYYSTMKSGLGYKKELEKIPNVVYTLPTNLSGTLDKVKRTYAIKWSDSNGDMLDSMVVERKQPGSNKFERIATMALKDRSNGTGSSYTYTDTLDASGSYSYRVGIYPVKVRNPRYSEVISVSATISEGTDTFQWGSVTATNTDYTYSYFNPKFDDLPVVITGPISNNNSSTPLCHHLHSVKRDYFQYRFFPWTLADNQAMTKDERMDFVAVVRGNGTAGGLRYEAQQIAGEQMDSAYAHNTYGRLNNEVAYIHFVQPFEPGDTPVVFVNVVTTRDTYPLMWKVFDVTNEGFKIQLCREAGRAEKTFISESVFYLAIEQGTGQLTADKRITVGYTPNAVGGITARPIEFGDSLVNPLLWGEPQTANETRAAITRFSTLNETGVRVRRTIDSSEKKTSGGAMEDFGWMVVSDGQVPEGIHSPISPADRRIVRTDYFTLDGRRTDAPLSGGIYLQRTTYHDGTVETKKLFH